MDKNDNSRPGFGSKHTYYQKGCSTYGNHTVESKALEKYFTTSNSIQHSQSCVESLGEMPLATTGESAICPLEEVDDLITV